MREVSEREFRKAARTLRLGGMPPTPIVVELLERWEREDFDDCLPPWHRINLWRRRAYWERDYVFRF
jgi:hypothetical protein